MSRTTSDALAPHRYVTSDLATVAPLVRNPLNLHSVMRCTLVAILPCVAVALYNTGLQANLARAATGAAPDWRAGALGLLGIGQSPASALDCAALGALYFLPILAAAWLGGAACERGFARARGRRADHFALAPIALLFALALPATLSLWQAALGCAIGVAIGKEVFGGFGRGFVHPTVVGLAFLYFAYPGALSGDAIWVGVPGHVGPTPLSLASRAGLEGLQAAGLSWSTLALGRVPGAMGETSALACALGLAVLIHTGVASWRIVAGGVLGLWAGVVSLQALELGSPIATLPWHWHLVSGSFAFGLVYLATDPTSAAATRSGRWLYGALIGGFVAVVRIANPAYEEGVVLALLLGSVCAPLLDRIAGLLQMRWHEATRGR